MIRGFVKCAGFGVGLGAGATFGVMAACLLWGWAAGHVGGAPAPYRTPFTRRAGE